MGHYYNTPHPQPLRGVPPLVVLACPHTQHTETSILFLLEKNHLPLCSHTLPPHADSQAKQACLAHQPAHPPHCTHTTKRFPLLIISGASYHYKKLETHCADGYK